jgi:hypothetical protein
MSAPDSNFLPGPLWCITSLHVLTLTLHFAAMNFLLGGVLWIVTGKFRKRREDPALERLIKLLPGGMAATVTLGVAPLLFMQLLYPRQIYSAAIVSGCFWLLVIPTAITVYYLLYGMALSGDPGMRSARWCLWSALSGLIYISLVYSSVFSMAERPDLIRKLYAQVQSGLGWNPEVKDYLFR